MVSRYWKDIQEVCLEEGYAKIAVDLESRPKRRFTQADLDAAYKKGYEDGKKSNADLP